MDPSAFDTLARSFAQTGTRRRLLTLLLALPLGGVLTTIGQDEVTAERPLDRIQRRTPQRNRNQRNNNKNKNNRNTNGGGGRLGAGGACHTAADCTSGACCGGTCCLPPANQCNRAGECCAPNCGGKQCGPDGCGGTGTCGSCPPCQTCNSDTAECQPAPNGTPCGTQPGGGTTRCCSGACPTPTCHPPGPITPTPATCAECQICCAASECEVDDSSGVISCSCESIGVSPGAACGSNADCTAGASAGLSACICGGCHSPPS